MVEDGDAWGSLEIHVPFSEAGMHATDRFLQSHLNLLSLHLEGATRSKVGANDNVERNRKCGVNT